METKDKTKYSDVIESEIFMTFQNYGYQKFNSHNCHIYITTLHYACPTSECRGTKDEVFSCPAKTELT